MFEYRNVVTGRVVKRPYADEYLEASKGWERIPAEPSGADQEEGSED